MLRINKGYMEDRRLLASAALFRQLQEKKKDVYDVLAQFIRSSISWSSSWSFNITECSVFLEENFGFKIPDAVIRSCLNNRLKKKEELTLNNGTYSITEKFVITEDLKDDYEGIQGEHKFLITALIEYAESAKKTPLDESERAQISSDFHDYFLGGLKPSENSVLISEFIIKNSDNQDFVKKLNRVEEGLILYSGICYSSNSSAHAPWRNDFTIYLDTEVLFFTQDFNGSLHKKIFFDFYDLTKEINESTKGKAKINLRYFPETKREIDDFFYAAEKIVERQQVPDPSKSAMVSITNGCKNAGDVIIKKSKFYTTLDRLKIYEEGDLDYYSNPDYVIDDQITFNALKKDYPEFEEEKIYDILRIFTKINYFRRGLSNKGLEQSSAILASGKYLARALTFSEHVLQDSNHIPFATDLDYLTERFWLKLNKGFNDSKVPIAFDVVSRAQVILSTEAGNKVASDYKELVGKVQSGDMSNENASHLLSELRSRKTMPEDFSPSNIEEYSSFLHSEFVESTLRQKAVLEQKAKEGELSQAQVLLLEEKIKKQTDLTAQQKDLYSQEIKKVNLINRAHLRARDITLHKEKLKPIRNAARRELKVLFIFSFGVAIAAGILIVTRLQSDSDTALSKLSVLLGILPLFITVIMGKSLRRRFEKIISSRFRQRRRKTLIVKKLSSYSEYDQSAHHIDKHVNGKEWLQVAEKTLP